MNIEASEYKFRLFFSLNCTVLELQRVTFILNFVLKFDFLHNKVSFWIHDQLTEVWKITGANPTDLCFLLELWLPLLLNYASML
jgi:hypothetical protein